MMGGWIDGWSMHQKTGDWSVAGAEGIGVGRGLLNIP
jgi:hypothetical protein